MGKRNSLDEMLAEFRPEFSSESRQHQRSVTFWISEDHKEKFNAIQSKSGRKFGKVLRKLFEAAIEKTYGGDDGTSVAQNRVSESD